MTDKICTIRRCGRPALEHSEFCEKHINSPKKCRVRGCANRALRNKVYCGVHQDFEEDTTIFLVKRKCLKCGKSFRSYSPYIRLCSACKRSPEWHHGDNFDY